MSDDPYFDLFGDCCEQVTEDNNPDLAAQRHFLVEKQVDVSPASSDGTEYIKCDKCGNVDSKLVWKLKPKFDNPVWPRKTWITN